MLRRWFSPRSMLWHVLMVAIVGGCSYAAWWQWHRAAGGNTLSYLYSVEWPAFAIVAIVGWWQLVTEPPEELAARREERRLASLPKPVAYDAEVLRRELAAHPELVRAFPEVVKAFPELRLAELGPSASSSASASSGSASSSASSGSAGSASSAGSSGAAGELGSGGLADSVSAGQQVVPVGSGGGLAVPSGAEVTGEEVVAAPSEVARSYNAMLGSLAATGKPKTWRNPRGR